MPLFSKTKLIITAIIALFAAAIIAPQIATAEGEVGHFLSISPPDQRITLRPGEQYRTSIRVSNQAAATEDLEFSLAATPFSVTGGDDEDGDYTQIFDVNSGDSNQIVEWISFDQTTGTVAPNSVTEVGITINVPENAPAGGQYVGIAVTDQTADDQAQGAVTIHDQRRAVMIIYASVAGQTEQTGSVLEDNINAFFLSSPISATALLENTGNVHADAECILKVYSLFSGEELYSNEDDETNAHIVMPNTRRFITTSWDNDKTPSIGLFRVEQAVTYLGKTTTTTQTVLVIPIWLLLIIVFIIVFIIVWVVLRSKKKQQKQPSQPAKVIDVVKAQE